MTTKEILIKAKDLIPDYEHWSTGVRSALDKGAITAGFGGPVFRGPVFRAGLCYCAHGAIAVAAGDWPVDSPDAAMSDEAKAAVAALARAISPDYNSLGGYHSAVVVENFNDRDVESLEELHAKFDEAIATAD